MALWVRVGVGLVGLGWVGDSYEYPAARVTGESCSGFGLSGLNAVSCRDFVFCQVVDVEPRRLVLLVKGQLLPRPPTISHPGVEMHTAPCLLTDVSGRLVFTKDTKMFLIPLSIVERSRCVFRSVPYRTVVCHALPYHTSPCCTVRTLYHSTPL